MAVSAGEYIDGISFHDDAYIGPYEDASESAIHYYHNTLGYTDVVDRESLGKLLNDSSRLPKFAAQKAKYLNDFSLYMAEIANKFIKNVHGRSIKLLTTRHLYSSAFLNPNAYTWLGQDPDSLYKDYDFVSIEVYPFMESRNESGNFYLPACVTAENFQPCLNVDEKDYYNILIEAVKKRDSKFEKLILFFKPWTGGIKHISYLTS